ncbi:MAG: ATP synthase F1 subunit gamma [Christensenellaceae bacterium]|jgi:F-type H+-transporting ATPase subunit gamma|nr:ATP synthase F1 subunit gamma [Christensenellaceae bacterium]
MANISEIKTRIKSIRDTGQITKAMELISVSKMRFAGEAFAQNMAYFMRAKEVMSDILAHIQGYSHPYLEQREVKNTVYIVIAGDIGLAGAYNHRVLAFADEAIKSKAGATHVFTIGNMAAEFFKAKGFAPDLAYLYKTQRPQLEDARKITEDVITLFADGKADEIRVIYTTSLDGKTCEAQDIRLLPLLYSDFERDDDDISGTAAGGSLYEPDANEVCDILAEQYIVGMLYSAMIQSVKCEHQERMQAMHNATENAGDILEELSLAFHRARQTQITTEVTEISSANLMTSESAKKAK